MKQIVTTLALAFCLHQGLLFTVSAASRDELPEALLEMANTERAFARRAQEVGPKQAFLEYFDDSAVGFETGTPAPAKDGLRAQPDPPKDVPILFWWEPRYGDIAASGDLGWLTGPVRSARPDRNGGAVRHGNYMSVWKRQPDGTFKVVIDVGIDPTGEVPFATGFTRAAFENRYTGWQIAPLAESSLVAADRAFIAAARRSMGDAYRAVLAPTGRIHRTGRLPMQGHDAAAPWLEIQPPLADAEPLYAEVAQSADLGYTWGSYSIAAAPGGKAESGHYVRVWVREASGAWKVAVDVTQPRRAG